ncbi:MAG: hypothetical protein HY913_09635 [Desulfomonile tiedjei]|nr:hypothetical protein [Desulfomonile tiedjei]
MKFRIVAAEWTIHSEDVLNTAFEDEHTWADADILVIAPPALTDLFRLGGFQAKSILERRRKEVEGLLMRGKLVCTYLLPYETQRSKEPPYPDLHSPGPFRATNYDWLPQSQFTENLTTALVPGRGYAIDLVEANHPFAAYFRAFQKQLVYEACLTTGAKIIGEVFLKNKAGNFVGFTWKVHRGRIVFLPRSLEYVDPVKLINVLVEGARPYLTDNFRTPAPDWTKSFLVPGEAEILASIESVEKERALIEAKLGALTEDKNELAEFRGLLYEQGRSLEEVVLRALNLMGFAADRFRQDDMEHDVVMESNEGRALAEVEGKDRKPINVDKIDQLSRVVDEDFNERGDYSHGVLIGNPFRLVPLDQRGEPFTEKARKAAERKQFGLLTTAELFKAVVKILENPEEEDFKLGCRKAILETKGKEVVFPSPK